MEVLYKTNRLIVKVFEADDLNAAKDFWGNAEVMAYCGGSIPYEKLGKVIDAYIRCHKEKGLSVYAVVEKETEKVIGAAGFNIRGSLENIELLYHFSKDSWGKGYATEAADACVKIAKKNAKVRSIYASADQGNAKSLKILEKIGFEYKGMKWFEDTQQEEPYYEMLI
ncbi:GNAT family N-acetyltransferase [Lederbergia citri]|uniref:GNAT family N-acetyltransferase n=1 Tax=Lederbergia citri TaxID=2833580 RepID=A0A942TEY8_9BACI|nr:GNAT family N-acetyltransferase [Lederbergia citri]MBS4194992.1 GNAT family N-acetyltransferase [Lederbergia citri]